MSGKAAEMRRRYVTVDVFTDRIFGGNPLAVVLDATGLSGETMQAIALEFNYSETTFVLPADDASHTAKVRIFTPRVEVPFAGHPNVGTAFALASDSRFAAAALKGEFVFEEAAGLVPITLLQEEGTTLGAELRAPEVVSRRGTLTREEAAACLSLLPGDILTRTHSPQVVSVGLPFLAVEVKDREALRRARPDAAAHAKFLPPIGTDAVFTYWRATDARATPQESVLHARTFSPIDGVIEDPATGSACAAVIALLATTDPTVDARRAWRIHQGVDMGRPSLLLGRTVKSNAVVADTYIGGRCVAVLEGILPSSI